MDYLCECFDPDCALTVEIPSVKACKLQDPNDTLVVIVDGCKRGPQPTDRWVETCDGYKVYREKGDS